MSKQIVASVAVALGLVSGACGGSDGLNPREGCEQLMVALCGQIYACYTASEIMAEDLPAMEAACVMLLQEDAACAQQTDENACDANETFHAEEAQSCVNQIKALSCAQVRGTGVDLMVAAPSCSQVCAVD